MIRTGPAIGFAKFIDHTDQKINRTLAVYGMNRKYSPDGLEVELQKANEELFKLFKDKGFYTDMMLKCEDENDENQL